MHANDHNKDNEVVACTCKITIDDFVCDACEYCDHTKTNFAYDCGVYGKGQCPP